MAITQTGPGKAAKEKLYTLELGRFLAASVVVLTHWLPEVNSHARAGQQIFGGFAAPGALGVQYFFVLSGFVMASAHHQDFGRLSSPLKFWWRRACRIYPVYWLALCIPAYYLYGFMTPDFSFRLFSLVPWSNAEFIAPAWTLRYEMSFYIMFGLALLPYIGRPILALWIFAVFWRWAPHGLLGILHLPPPYLINKLSSGWADKFTAYQDFYFFAGLLAGILAVKWRPGVTWSAVLTAFGCIAGLLALPYIKWGDAYGPPAFVMMFCLVLAALLLGVAGLERNGKLRLPRLAATLGALSYPLYILHTPLMLVFHTNAAHLRFGGFGMYFLFLAGLVVIYAASQFVTVFYDQPIQKGLRRFSRAVARRPATA